MSEVCFWKRRTVEAIIGFRDVEEDSREWVFVERFVMWKRSAKEYLGMCLLVVLLLLRHSWRRLTVDQTFLGQICSPRCACQSRRLALNRNTNMTGQASYDRISRRSSGLVSFLFFLSVTSGLSQKETNRLWSGAGTRDPCMEKGQKRAGGTNFESLQSRKRVG